MDNIPKNRAISQRNTSDLVKPHSPIQVILVATIPAVLSMRKEVIRALSHVIIWCVV